MPAIALLILCALLLRPALAFESHEHREMSSLALALALEYTTGTATPQAKETDKYKNAVAKLQAIRDDYGTITQCVDYFLYPEKILAFDWKVREESQAGHADAHGGIPAQSISSRLKQACETEGAAFLQASHNNHAHFQQDLLMSWRLWHLLGVSLAQQEGNLYGGLLANAIADHYLQDFFAPGHLVTPRDHLSDLPATGTHDLANRMGALFRPTLFPRLTQVLEFLCPAPAESGQSCVPREGLLKLLASQPRAAGHAKPALRFDRLADEVGMLRKRRPVLLRGDDQLAGEAQARQRVLMLAVQVGSILDVIEGVNSFRTVHFSYSMGSEPPMATMDFGSYDFHAAGKLHASLTDEAMDDASARPDTARATGRSEFNRLSMCSLGSCDDRLYRLRTRPPIFSVSDERSSQSNGSYHARNLYSLEVSGPGYLLDVSKLSGRWLSGVEIAPVLGYAVFDQGHFKGHGPSLRLTMTVPETELAFGPYVRWLRYDFKREHARRMSFGLRAETGFSSYLTFYVFGGIDHGVSSDGIFVRGRAWGGGVRIGAPLTRLTSSNDAPPGAQATR